MLISCYQCRQQLDVPCDAAGKRIRCPHCQYVIVAPAPTRDVDAPPATGLPHMELDGAAEYHNVPTEVAPHPLPPIPTPKLAVNEPELKDEPPFDALPSLPSIDKNLRWRWPINHPPRSKVRWGAILGVGGVAVLILVAVVGGIVSSTKRQHRHAMPKMVIKEQAPMPMPPPDSD